MVSSLNDFDAFLDSVRIPVRLACKTESDWPMVVSLWYLHQDGKLYCATQKTAKIISYLQHDSRVGFEIAEDRPPYCGLRGQAVATINESLGIPILEKLLVRYLGGTQNSLAEKLLAKAENEVAIVLDPVQVFTWDFSPRMQDIVSPSAAVMPKVCP
jgi:hypothetical protein